MMLQISLSTSAWRCSIQPSQSSGVARMVFSSVVGMVVEIYTGLVIGVEFSVGSWGAPEFGAVGSISMILME